MWSPHNLDSHLPLYRALAEVLANDIHSGRLSDGERLPTVRALAKAMDVTVGTVLRAYALSEQRGLVSRRVGHGTFVTGATQRHHDADDPNPESSEIADCVDLSRNEPPYVNLDSILKRSLDTLAREHMPAGLLDYGDAAGRMRHREKLSLWLGKRGVAADPTRIVITGGAQQGLTIAMGALTTPGDRMVVEAYAYPGVRNLARFFGLTPLPVAMDAEGLLLDALEKACRQHKPRLLYCMPHAHNPTACTYTPGRRLALVECARRHGLIIIEDDVNLREGPSPQGPIITMAPERTIYISSLSKAVAPGLRVGMAVAPNGHYDAVLAASQTINWMAPPLMAELACRWIEDGTADSLMTERLALARWLQARAAEHFSKIAYSADPDNPHVWIALPEPWTAEEFTAYARENGVIVSPSSLFAMGRAADLSAIRICLTNRAGNRLDQALRKLARLIAAPPALARFRM